MQYLKPQLKAKHLTYGYLLLLLTGALIPLGPINTTLSDNYTLNIRWDYLLHVVVYLPLPFLIWISLLKRSTATTSFEWTKARFWLLVVLFPFFTTSLFEALQLLIPYRSFNINDLLAGCIGVLLGILLIPLFRKFSVRLIWP